MDANDERRMERIESLALDASRRMERVEERVESHEKLVGQRLDSLEGTMRVGLFRIERTVRRAIRNEVRLINVKYSWVRRLAIVFLSTLIALAAAAWVADRYGRSVFSPLTIRGEK